MADLSLLDRALILSVRAHAGQTDKAGQPYIIHPLRVMTRLGLDATEEQRIWALLHDVIEDTDITLEDLRREGFSEAIVAAVDAATRRKGETYDEYLKRVAENPIASKGKLADLADNSDPERLNRLSNEERDRLSEKYRKVVETLNKR